MTRQAKNNRKFYTQKEIEAIKLRFVSGDAYTDIAKDFGRTSAAIEKLGRSKGWLDERRCCPAFLRDPANLPKDWHEPKKSARKQELDKAFDPLNSLKSAETPAASLQNAVPIRERQFAELDQELNKFDAYQELLRKNKLLKESINTLLCLLIGMALAVAYIAITGA